MSINNLSHDHLFSSRFLWLKGLAILYTIALSVAHIGLPNSMIWNVAVFFSVAMNFTYPWAALQLRYFQGTELGISLFLIALSLLSLLYSPVYVIIAIFLHGAWDISKHKGAGVPFFSWYTLGCVTIDWIYAATLFTIFLI